MKPDKMSYITFSHHKFLIKKTDGCKNNPEKSSKIKIDEHIQCQLHEILIVQKISIVYILEKII